MELCSLPVIYLVPNCGGGNGDNGDLLQRSHACTATLTAPNPAAGHLCPTPLLETPGHSRASLGQSCGVTAPSFWVLVHTRSCLCPLSLYFPALCKFWRLYGGVDGDLLQEGLRHTQVGCTQSPCPCCSALLNQTSTGDAQTQFCLVSVDALGPGAHKVRLSSLSISGGSGV